jgi:circadian clock protein KaiB
MSVSPNGPPGRREDSLVPIEDPSYELTLFVCGASELSARAIADARELCDLELPGSCRLSVVDVHEGGAAALSCGVLATPTLVKNWPLPVRKFVGDLSHTDRVLLALQLPARHAAT